MSAPLSLFPARVAFVDPKTGLLTPEALRALSVLLARSGGIDGDAVAGMDIFAPFVPQEEDLQVLLQVQQPAEEVAASDAVISQPAPLLAYEFPMIQQAQDAAASLFGQDVTVRSLTATSNVLVQGVGSNATYIYSQTFTPPGSDFGGTILAWNLSGVGETAIVNSPATLAGGVILQSWNGLTYTTMMTVRPTGTSIAEGLGINGKAAVADVAAPTAAGAAYGATEQTLLNDIRTRLQDFGIYT